MLRIVRLLVDGVNGILWIYSVDTANACIYICHHPATTTGAAGSTGVEQGNEGTGPPWHKGQLTHWSSEMKSQATRLKDLPAVKRVQWLNNFIVLPVTGLAIVVIFAALAMNLFGLAPQ